MKYVHIRHHSAANYTDIPGKDPKAHSRVGCYCHRMNAQSPLKSERAKPNIFFTRLLLLVCPMLAGPHKKRETRDASTAVLLRSTIYARSHTTIPQPVTPLLQRLSSTHARSTTLLCDRLHPSSAFAGGHRLWTCSPCDSTCVRSDTHRDRSNHGLRQVRHAGCALACARPPRFRPRHPYRLHVWRPRFRGRKFSTKCCVRRWTRCASVCVAPAPAAPARQPRPPRLPKHGPCKRMHIESNGEHNNSLRSCAIYIANVRRTDGVGITRTGGAGIKRASGRCG